MPLLYTEDRATCTVELTIRGQLGHADYAAVMVPMGALMQNCGTIHVIEVIESFSGFLDAPGVPHLPVDPDVLSRIGRVAIVSDIGWFCPILSSAPPGVSPEIRNFPLASLDAARAWAKDGAALR